MGVLGYLRKIEHRPSNNSNINDSDSEAIKWTASTFNSMEGKSLRTSSNQNHIFTTTSFSKACVVCQAGGTKHKSIYYCSICRVHLCIYRRCGEQTCYQYFHSPDSLHLHHDLSMIESSRDTQQDSLVLAASRNEFVNRKVVKIVNRYEISGKVTAYDR